MSNLNFIRLVLAVILMVSTGLGRSSGQCCSAGSPVGVGTYAGMVAKNTLRVTTFGRFTHSAGYYTHDSKISTDLLGPAKVKQSNFVFQGLNISYGIIKGLAADRELGYFYLKDQTLMMGYYQKGYGLSNGVLMLKTGIFHSDSLGLELSGGVGLKFPFSTEPLMVDHVELNFDLQPSTNALGLAGQLFFRKVLEPHRMALYFVNRYEYNFANYTPKKYQSGSRLRSSLILERNITPKFGAMLQVRYEYGTYDKFYDVSSGAVKRYDNSGSSLFFVTPMLLYSIACKWHVSVSADIPFYKFYNGEQLSNQYSIALNLTRDFSLSKK